MEFAQLVTDRFSVRKFTGEPVSPEHLSIILHAARVAPTAVNRQPFRIVVVEGKDMEKLARATPYTFHAPMALIVCAVPGEAWVRPADGWNMAVVDASIVATHIMLSVHDLGLGTTWVGYFDPRILRTELAIESGLEPVAIFPVGHPAPDAAPSPKHSQYRSLDELVLKCRP